MLFFEIRQLKSDLFKNAEVLNKESKNTMDSKCRVVTSYFPTREVIDVCRSNSKNSSKGSSGHQHTRNREKRN